MSEKEPTEFEKLSIETGKKIADLLADPRRRSAFLKAAHDVEMMRLDPPAPPRSQKRKNQDTTGIRRAVRAGIWAAKHPFLRDETIDPLIKEALENGTAPEMFAAIAKGAEIARSKPDLSPFARHVICAFTAACHIMETEDRLPTKQEVRKSVEAIFKEKKWGGFLSQPQRWTEIFNACSLGDLDIGKPGEG